MTKNWKLTTKKVFHFPLLYMNIYIVDFCVSNRHTGEMFFRLRDVFVDKSWLTALNPATARKKRRSGTEYTFARNGNRFEFPDYKIIKILDSKELPNI